MRQKSSPSTRISIEAKKSCPAGTKAHETAAHAKAMQGIGSARTNAIDCFKKEFSMRKVYIVGRHRPKGPFARVERAEMDGRARGPAKMQADAARRARTRVRTASRKEAMSINI
ncbi:hypothetical protein [Slackia faecicanis]|uniref:hypothetical protein n=1 Tax=Slackia faecicanis TaxID=255723 RepID=UPI001FCF1247|nr:hypothetical protein [Slackia faecicanis]